MKNRKRIFLWGCILLVLAWVLAGAFLVIRASMSTFEHQLYFRHNNLSASSLFLSLFTRHTLFIIAFMLAVMLLALHIVTATGIDDLLKCALLMLTAAGFDACQWNRDVLFLVSSRFRLFWMHTHDTMLVLFFGTMLSLLIPRLVAQLPVRRACFILRARLRGRRRLRQRLGRCRFRCRLLRGLRSRRCRRSGSCGAARHRRRSCQQSRRQQRPFVHAHIPYPPYPFAVMVRSLSRICQRMRRYSFRFSRWCAYSDP